MMQWQKLLTPKRNIDSNKKESVRSTFLRDVDRLTFSSYFRKLQDKTQVYPLSKSSYVRTRLTHSLEVATVARSLGFMVGNYVLKNNPSLKNVTPFDFSYIIQAAALAHDIGNPPFGHKGEEIICHFYKEILKDLDNLNNNLEPEKQLTEEQKENLIHFDGNAQGFRIITNLISKNNNKGLNLTYPTLGAFLKYPSITINKKYIGHSKTGIFISEHDIFNNMAQSLELKVLDKDENNNNVYSRHPLAFLLEASDDICYAVADFEDAFLVGILSFAEIEELFLSIIEDKNVNGILQQDNFSANILKNYQTNASESSKIEYLSSEVINILIHTAYNIFIQNEESILSGTFNHNLLDVSVFDSQISKLKEIAKAKIYNSPEKSKAEISGMTAIKAILTQFKDIVDSIYEKKSYSPKNHMINQLYLNNKLNKNNSLFENFQVINDFIVGCTDQNLIDVYHNISATK